MHDHSVRYEACADSTDDDRRLCAPAINNNLLCKGKGKLLADKPVNIVHGEPNITWKISEVKSLIIQENLQKKNAKENEGEECNELSKNELKTKTEDKKEKKQIQTLNKENPKFQREEQRRIEGEEAEGPTEGTFVVYGIDSKEILPLAIQNELGENLMQKEEIMDEIDVNQNINRVALEGDLSPKKVNKLRDTQSKKKKQRENDN
ncbi:hypothetical protein MTR67_022723 [Solanum verrucosum]|uniref:Uncharacterized protein n=1 Tax=Solanum verrucosum TaxID=315347 RepID=A0AAF0QU03_SOLVR|nr:hypothetical protein MTR67_022723 [Solanum verrucosum]